MSRLQQYITEENIHLTPLPINTKRIIHRDCKKYLKLLKYNRPFYRGVFKNVEPGEWLKKNVRQDRHPMGTSNKLFKKLNKWLSKNDHTRRDKAVSASSSYSTAGFFGVQYYFFPIGNFNYTWIKAKDLNKDDGSTGWEQSNINYFFDDEGEYELQMDNEDRKKFSTYFTTNKGIKTAHEKGYEIWFDCKEYYIVNWDMSK